MIVPWFLISCVFSSPLVHRSLFHFLQPRFIQTGVSNATAASSSNSTCSATQPCRNGGTCSPAGTCACTNGFSGQLCEVDICSNVVCPIGDFCNQEGKCVKDTCGTLNCLNGATCSKGVCNCKNNFTGPFCEVHPCENVKCINGGFCLPPGTCQCLNQFTGQFCENSPCSGVTCLNNGKCLYGQCVCMPEWSGLRCERPSEAARDYKVYSDAINSLADNVAQMGARMQQIRNVTAPAYISNTLRQLVRDIEVDVVNKAKEDSKRDWATPKVIGHQPVYKNDMKMPNTPYENAKIYEDKDLAYQKARQIKDKKLAHALDVVSKYDAQRALDALVIAKDVPGAEYVSTPFGGFAEVSEKYDVVDNSLLEQDLEHYRQENSMIQNFIEQA